MTLIVLDPIDQYYDAYDGFDGYGNSYTGSSGDGSSAFNAALRIQEALAAFMFILMYAHNS